MMILLVPLILIGIAIFSHYYWAYNFSRNPAIPMVFPPRFPLGNLDNPFMLKKHVSELLADHYETSKRLKSKIMKLFCLTQPFYLVCDPEYVKYTLQNDFESFSDRGINYNEKYDPLSTNLFFVNCPKWNYIRSKLSPTYTIVKLKTMFETVLECGRQMQQYVEHVHQQDVDVLDISTSYTINVIASCAFGVECDCFKNPDSEFKKRSKQTFLFPIWRIINVISLFTYPKLAQWMGLVLFEKSLTEFFVGVTRDVMEYRSKNGIRRNDMLQLLIDSQNSLNDEPKLTVEDITAQVFVFFAAGFETSSGTLTFCLYELAVNTQVQSKLREEVFEVLKRHDEKISYEATMEMKYMNQVIDETLRKYPPLAFLLRRCTKNYKFPDVDCTVQKGEIVMISVLGLHHDSDHFPEPSRFDPDRFSNSNKPNLRAEVYIPFGEGPRNCIGQRFAMMQLKIALSVLLLEYSFTLSEKTVTPIKFDTRKFTLIPRERIFLTLNKITDVNR